MMKIEINGVPSPKKDTNKPSDEELIEKLKSRREKFDPSEGVEPPSEQTNCPTEKVSEATETVKSLEKALAEAKKAREEKLNREAAPVIPTMLGEDEEFVAKWKKAHQKEVEVAKENIAKTRNALKVLEGFATDEERRSYLVEEAQRISAEYNDLVKAVDTFAKAHPKFPRFILDGVMLNKYEEKKPVLPLREQAHLDLCEKIHDVYKRKNADYGGSFTELYDKFGIQAANVFLTIKYNRFQELLEKEAQVVNESIDDTLLDLANYCLLTLVERNVRKDDSK